MASLREWVEILWEFLKLKPPVQRPFNRDTLKTVSSEVPIILLVGRTGSGKSSFVKSLTDQNVLVFHEENPCTMNCEVYTVKVDFDGTSKVFVLIDTPGLQGLDSKETNLKVLEKIAATLNDVRDLELKLAGAIFFHNIAGNKRFTSALDIFAAMCGKEFRDSKQVAFLTTQWDSISSEKSVISKYGGYHEEIGRRIKNLYPEWPVFARERDDAASCKKVLEHFSDLTRSGDSLSRFALLEEWRSGKEDIRETSAGRKVLGLV
ncbi:hypothetical protein QBC47DRAFT_190731 [Echria macrotheca]|uniref:G domain-containing protein n=1 Tax=Echria macrotheca TaxID=438768 RepID=A0AAJ0BC21_9PEZI|nr:hypothetical protein QBC47DRAFT_190731 [Echria macrotheca]